MPSQTKQKPAPAASSEIRKIETAPALTSEQKFEARRARYRLKAKVINNLLGDIDGPELEELETVRLILSRTSCGIDGPIEKFIESLIHLYAWAEERGKGLTVANIESELEELREDMEFALGEAYFIADRYPRPEASDAE